MQKFYYSKCDDCYTFVRFKGGLAYLYKAEFFLNDDSLSVKNIRALQNGVSGFLRSACPANERSASGFIDQVDVSLFEIQNGEKSLFHVFPHIFCVATKL